MKAPLSYSQKANTLIMPALTASLSTNPSDPYLAVTEYVNRRSRTFRLAARLLPPDKRRIATITYAFFRLLDDMVDEDEISLAEFRTWRAQADGHMDKQTDPILAAWADVRERYGIDPQLIENVLDGIEMDIAKQRYATLDNLLQYCHRVATSGAFLALSIVRMKAEYTPEEAKPQVEKLALGVQLTDILCDIGEDAAKGRIYLPEEILMSFGLTCGDIEARVYDERFKRAVQYLVEIARSFFVEGWPVLNCFPPAERLAAGFMCKFHWAALDKVERIQYNVYEQPITFSTADKMWLLASYLPAYLRTKRKSAR